MNTSSSHDDKTGETKQSFATIQSTSQRPLHNNMSPSSRQSMNIDNSNPKETSVYSGSSVLFESCNANKAPSQNSAQKNINYFDKIMSDHHSSSSTSSSHDRKNDEVRMQHAGNTVEKPIVQSRPDPQSMIKKTDISSISQSSNYYEETLLKAKNSLSLKYENKMVVPASIRQSNLSHTSSSTPTIKLAKQHHSGMISPSSVHSSNIHNKNDNPLYVSGVFYSAPMPMNQSNKHSMPYMYPTASKGLIMNPSIQRSDNTNTRPEPIVMDQKRTQLMETYSPYIVPNDESVGAARARLRKAIDQTRQLREAFTDRVYNKYRIVLRPVSKNVDDIVDNIMVDPVASKLRLENESKTLKEEKEIEKREALQKAASIAAANAGASESGEAIDITVTNPDDHYFGAGLNIVILPEEDIDENDPILRQYEHRGPTDPDTGQRLGGISSAAAAAAETVLERTRRGISLRTERTRMTSFDKNLGDKNIFEKKLTSPINNFALKSVVPLNKRKTGRVSGSDLLSLQSHSNIGMENNQESRGFNNLSKSQGVAGTASTSSLLVISSRAEVSGSASAAALVMAGVGTSISSKNQQQNMRRRHPFPKSKAGLALSSTSSSKKSTHASLPSMRQSSSTLVKDELLLPNNIEMRRKKVTSKYVDVTDELAPNHVQSLKSVTNILQYFQNDVSINEPAKTVKKSENRDSNQSPIVSAPKIIDKTVAESTETPLSQSIPYNKNNIPTPMKRKRKVNEIGLLRGIRFNNHLDSVKAQSDKLQSSSQPLKTDHVQKETTSCHSIIQKQKDASQNDTNSILAYSVLFALGIFGGRTDFQRHFKECSTAHRSKNNPHDNQSAVLNSVKLMKDEVLELRNQGISDTIFKHCKPINRKRNLLKIDKKDEAPLNNTQYAAIRKRSRQEEPGEDKSENQKTPKIVKLDVPMHKEVANEEAEHKDEKKVMSPIPYISEVCSNRPDFNKADKKVLPIVSNTDSSKNKIQAMNSVYMASKQVKGLNQSYSTPGGSADLMASVSLPSSTTKALRETGSKIKAQTPIHQSIVSSDNDGKGKGSRSNIGGTFSTALPPMIPQNQQTPPGWNTLVGRYPQNQALLQNQGQLYQSLNVGMDQGYLVLPQGTSANPYTSALAHSRGLSATQQHLNHSHVPLLGSNAERFSNTPSPHMLPTTNNRSPIIYPESLNHLPSPNAQDYIDYYNSGGMHRQPNSPPFVNPSDWPSLSASNPSLLNQSSASMMGLNLTAAQARNMIIQLREQSRAMIAREQQNVVATAQAIQAATAARNNLNNLSNFSAHVGNNFPQSILSQHNNPSINNKGDALNSRQHLTLSGIRQAVQNSPQQVANKTLAAPITVDIASALKNMAPSSSTKSNLLAPTRTISTQQPVTTKQPNTKISKQDNKEIKKPIKSPKTTCSTEQSRPGKNLNSSLPSTRVTKSFVTDKTFNMVKDNTDKIISSGASRIKKQQPSPSVPSVSTVLGLRFFCPQVPSGLSLESAELILQGHIFEVGENKQLALDYLLAIGKAVPIPKALVQNPLKERTGSIGKDVSRVPSYATKDVVIAAITGWLWAEHEDCFQSAFIKSGRIDVDPECKWLIYTAVDESIMSMHRALDMKGSSKLEEEFSDYEIACVICNNLMRDICIDDDMDVSSTNFQELTKLLDARREMALKHLCKERVLLANLLSRHVNMSEFFSNAYVSSMVRAGEALGHEDLFELVHDDECFASSLLPYDVIADLTGAWEEPCQPEGGFNIKLSADELSKRAHARSRIQKSLFKLQDKFGLKGGVQNAGPYADTSANESSIFTSFPTPLPGSRGTSLGIRRRSSSGPVQSADFSSNPVKAGLSSGMAQVFNPSHHSAPLLWDLDDIHNKPYGIHGSQGKKGRRHKKARHGHSSPSHKNDSKEDHSQKNTVQTDWMNVAMRFHSVTTEASSQNASKEKIESIGPIIIAPVVHELEDDAHLKSGTDSESDLEEDISDEAVLARHQEVLDAMKRKLEVALEATPRRR